jgi:hypothetical protein
MHGRNKMGCAIPILRATVWTHLNFLRKAAPLGAKCR